MSKSITTIDQLREAVDNGTPIIQRNGGWYRKLQDEVMKKLWFLSKAAWNQEVLRYLCFHEDKWNEYFKQGIVVEDFREG